MTTLPILATLLALAVAAPAPAASILPEARETAPAGPGPAAQGFAAIARGDLDAAERHFTALRQADPAAPAAWLGLAEVAARRGNVAETERLLRAGIAQAPHSSHLHRALGRLMAQRGDPEGTVAAFVAAQQAQPDEALSYFELAEILHERFGQAERALPFYAAALERDPRHWKAAYGRGLALARAGRPAEALSVLAEAARLGPHSPLPDYARAQILMRQNRPQEALAAFDAALARDPELVPARLGKGGVLLGQGRPRDAIPEFEHALARVPNEVNALLGLGMARQAEGDAVGAEAAFRAVLARTPQHPIALNNLAWLTVERGGDLDEAVRWAEAAVTALPNDPSVITTLGWVRRARGELPQAEAALAQAVTLQPNADRLTRLAMVRAAMGRRDEALADLRRALELQPGYAPARQELERIQRN
mgnify:CR=1 FL=1